MTNTVAIPGKTTSAKFFTSIGFAALIAALQAIAGILNADPALQQWGTLVLAVVGAFLVWRVPNRLVVTPMANQVQDPVDLLSARMDSLRIEGFDRTGDTFTPTPTVVVAPTSDEDVGTGRTADSERAY